MPPNNLIAIPRMPPSVESRIRQPFNAMAVIFESWVRSLQFTRDGEEFVIGGGGGGGDTGAAEVFFPYFLPGPVAYTTAPNRFLTGQHIYTGGNANVGLTIQQTTGSQTANLFQLVGPTGTVLAAFISNASQLIMPSSFGIGVNSQFAATGATALGDTARATGTGSTAIGNSSLASGTNSVALGILAQTTKASTVVIGVSALVTGTNSIAIGNTATAAFDHVTVFGSGVALATHEAVFGSTSALGVSYNIRLTGHSSTQARSLAEIRTAWISSTDASRTCRATFHVNDSGAATTGREYLRADSNGTGATVYVGFDSTFQGMVVNESGADADVRFEGDTATSLLVLDAGLDAVQIGTTTAGVIATFSNAGVVFNEDGDNRDFRVEGDNEPNLIYVQGSTDSVGIGTNSPTALLHVNGSLSCGQLEAGGISNSTGLAHDLFTPTRSAEANLDANVTMTQAQWMRVGNTITMSGRFTADPTTPATATSFEFTLPVASNFGNTFELAGVSFCGAIAGQGAAISASVANNTAVVSWVAGDVTSQTWSYQLTYTVI